VYGKTSEGQTYVDPTFARRLRNATYAGLWRFGGYHFCTPGAGSGESQADRLLKYAPTAPGRLRPCLDCEANPLHLNPGQLAAWYLGAVIRVKERRGYWPVLYGSPSYLAQFATVHADVFGRCPLWVAHYGVPSPTVPAPWSHFAAWQWTSAHHDPAVGTVDDTRVADGAALAIPLRKGQT
jgi:GH25 family lysozyme M1 (1,4-beta-N-acetylmuramidase)